MGMPEEEEEAGAGEGWLVSYADLMTLLFAAFVVLYALKIEGTEALKIGVVSNIRESFMEIPDDIPTEEKKGPIRFGKSHFQNFKGELQRRPMIQKFRKPKQNITLMAEDMKRVKELVDLLVGKDTDRPKVKSEMYAPISVKPYEKGFKINLLAGYFYKPGEYRMDRTALRKIDQIAEVLKGLDKPVKIEGHTDDAIPRGKMNNWDLSVFRATYLLKHLVNNRDFPSERISASGYADTRPVVENKTDKDRMMNRRVEIKVEYAD